jgi:hypothetical protein
VSVRPGWLVGWLGESDGVGKITGRASTDRVSVVPGRHAAGPADPKVTAVVVEHRGRLARGNIGLVASALAADGRRLVILDAGKVSDDLVRDMVGVLTSFCARLYGCRSARYRAEMALWCAEHDAGPGTV